MGRTALAALALSPGLLGAASAAEAGRTVYATSYPLAYFAERLGAGAVEVVQPKIAGDPAAWRPDAAELARMRRARLVLVDGAGHEAWMPGAQLPDKRLVDTSRALADRLLPETSEHLFPWQRQPDRPAPRLAPWLDPTLAASQAREIALAMIEAELAPTRQISASYFRLKSELEALDREFAEALAGRRETPIVAASQVYDYLARRYELSLKSQRWRGDVIPGETVWMELDALLGEHPARLMLWDEPPSLPVRRGLEDRGIEIVLFPTLERPPESGDYLSIMRKNLARLAEALTPPE